MEIKQCFADDGSVNLLLMKVLAGDNRAMGPALAKMQSAAINIVGAYKRRIRVEKINRARLREYRAHIKFKRPV